MYDLKRREYRAGVVEGEGLAHVVDERLHYDHLQQERHHQRDGLTENQQAEEQTNVIINIDFLSGKFSRGQRRVYVWNEKAETAYCAGIFKQCMRARNRVGIGLSHRPARLHRLADSWAP